MTRYIMILCAVALATAQTSLALAAPPAGAPAYHPVYHPTASRAAQMPPGRSDSQTPFKVPFNLNLHPQSQQFNPQTTVTPSRWHGWRPVPDSMSYQPIWYQLGCLPNNGLADTWSASTPIGAASAPKDFTIGSLAGDQSSSSFGSSPSDVAKVTGSGTGAAGKSGPLTLQYGIQSTPCGPQNYFGP